MSLQKYKKNDIVKAIQGVQLDPREFDIREKLVLCLESNIDQKPELTGMISRGIIKKEGCKIIRFNDMNELYDSIEGVAHSYISELDLD